MTSKGRVNCTFKDFQIYYEKDWKKELFQLEEFIMRSVAIHKKSIN